MSSNLQNNFGLLYRSYGGLSTAVKSSYFWLALWATGLSWRLVVSEAWIETAQTSLPTLAGFSIASFAIIIALFSKEDRRALKTPSAELGGRSPLLILMSSAGHTTIVQISTFVLSVILDAKSVPIIEGFSELGSTLNLVMSALGLFGLFYGSFLVVALILKVFKTIDLAS